MISPVCLSKLNRVFFCFSNSSGDIPAIRAIRSSWAPSLLISFSIPLKRLIPAPPPNSLLIPAAEASKPLATPIWFLRMSLSFFKMSSNGDASGPLPLPLGSGSSSIGGSSLSVPASVTLID